MPAIPLYEQQTRLSGAGPGPAPTDAGRGIEALGDALQGVADDQLKLAALDQQKREEQAVVGANSTLMAARSAWLTELQRRQQGAAPGAPNFTPQLLSDFDKDAATRLQSAQTPHARAWLQEQLGHVRLGLQQEAMAFEAGALVKQKIDGLSQSVDAARTAAAFRPQDFEAIATAQKTAIANSGLPREQQIELAQKHTAAIADAAVTGLIRQDPQRALSELDNEHSSAPGMQALDFEDRERLRQRAEAEIRERQVSARESLVAARVALDARVQDAQAAALAGIPVDDPPSRADFLGAYDAEHREEADRRYASFTDIQRVGADLQAVTRMTPAEQEQLLQSRLPKSSEGAASAMQTYSILARRVSDLQKDLERDPAGYVGIYNPTVRAVSQAFSQSPSPQAAQAYAQATISAQRALGVSQPHLLTTDAAHLIGQRLALSGNGQDTVAAIGEERQLWGRYWPQVLAEAAPKLNPAVQVIALGMDPVPAARLATVAAMKPDDLDKLLPPSIKPADLHDAISGAFGDFSASLIGQAGAEEQLGRLQDAAYKLASSYAAGGASLNDAARRAADEVVLSRYQVRNFRGSELRIPQGTDDDLVVTGLASTSEHVLHELNVRAGDVRWRTLPDDSGVVLEDATTNRPLASPDGTLVSYTFGALQQAAVNRAEAARRLTSTLRQDGLQP